MKNGIACGIVLCSFGGIARADSVIAYNNSAVAANQNYGGSLGLDFETLAGPVTITSLGAFDSGSAANLIGHDGSSGVTVAIYQVSTGTMVGSSITFLPTSVSTPGFQQVAGDAFLPTSIGLMPNTVYTVVAYNDINYNTQGGANTTSTENGAGKISFVGKSRYDPPVTMTQGPAISFPTLVDGGPSNRYDAGTFKFAVPSPSAVDAGVGLLGIFGLLNFRRRRRTGA